MCKNVCRVLDDGGFIYIGQDAFSIAQIIVTSGCSCSEQDKWDLIGSFTEVIAYVMFNQERRYTEDTGGYMLSRGELISIGKKSISVALNAMDESHISRHVIPLIRGFFNMFVEQEKMKKIAEVEKAKTTQKEG